jgi:hypothetical protein
MHLDTITPNNNLKRISFYSPNEGYIASTGNSSDFVGYSTDSGRTYIKKYITLNNVNFNGYSVNLTFGFAIEGVKAFNQNRIVVYGDYGWVPSILLSTDGGNTYTLIFHSQFDPWQLSGGINDMIFPTNGNVGYAVDADRILKTTDQGSSWYVIKTDPGAGYDGMEAIDDNNVFAFSRAYNANKFIKTTNAGAGWSNVNMPSLAGGNMNYPYFINSSTGWINMYDGNNGNFIYKTTNGANSWVLLNDAEANPFTCGKMKFVDANTGYALANEQNTIYKTLNGGVVWEPLQRDNNFVYLGYSHNDLQCLNTNQLWAGGNREFLEMSSNGGGTPLPKAYFKIDTSGYDLTGNVSLKNYSNTGHTFKWYVNDLFLTTTYNATYTHNVNNAVDSIKLVVTASNGKKDSVTKYAYFYVAPPPVPYTGWELKQTTINDNLTDIRFYGTRGVTIGNNGVYFITTGADNTSGWKKYIISNNVSDSQQLARTKFFQLAGNDKSPVFFAVGNDTVQNKSVLFRLNLNDSSYSFPYIGVAGTHLNAAAVTENNTTAGYIQMVGNNGLFVSYSIAGNSITVSSFNAPANLTSIHSRSLYSTSVGIVSNNNTLHIGNAQTGYTNSFSQPIGRNVTESGCNGGSVDYLLTAQKIYASQSGFTYFSLDSIYKYKPIPALQLNSLSIAYAGINVYAATNLGIYRVVPQGSNGYQNMLEYQPTSLNKYINRIWFKQNSQFDTGYAVGPNGVLFKTVNFGGPTKPYAEITSGPGCCINTYYIKSGLHGTGTSCKWYLDGAFLEDYCGSSSAYYMTVPGTHTLKYIASNQYGLADTATRTIYVAPVPAINLSFTASDTILCKAESIQVIIQNTEAGHRYELIEQLSGISYGGVNGNGGQALLVTGLISKPGYYYLRSSDINSQCFADFTNRVYISVEKTKSRFSGDKLNISVGEKLNFFNNCTDAQTFTWAFNQDPNINISTASNPQNIYYSSPGQKTLTLISTSANGCRDTLSNNAVFVYSKPVPADKCFSVNVDDSDYAYIPGSPPSISGPTLTDDNSILLCGSGNRPILKTRYGNNVKINKNATTYFVKYSEDGAVKWVNYIDTLGAILSSTVDANKNIYVVGRASWYYSWYHFNNGDSIRLTKTPLDSLSYLDKQNGFILKMDSAGHYLWHTILNNPTPNTGANSPGGEPTKLFVKGNSIAVIGGFSERLAYYRNGTSTELFSVAPFYNQVHDNFLIRIKPDGSLVWKLNMHHSAVNGSRAPDVSIDNNGNVFYADDYEASVKVYDVDSLLILDLTGNTAYLRSFFTKFDSTGHQAWSVKIKSQYQYASISLTSIINDNNGNSYLTGKAFTFGQQLPLDITNGNNTISVSDTVTSVALLKFGPDGKFKWSTGSKFSYYGEGAAIVLSGPNLFIPGTISNNNQSLSTFTFTSTDGANNTSPFYQSEFFIVHYDTSGVFKKIGRSGPNTQASISPGGIAIDNANNIIVPGMIQNYNGGYINNNFSIFNTSVSPNGLDAFYTKLNPNFCYAVTPPVAFAGNDTSICPAASVTLGSASVAGNTYSWSSGPAGFSSSAAMPVVSPAVTTAYYLSVMGPSGYFAFDTVVVSIIPAPVAHAGNDTLVCTGSSIQIGTPALAGNTYSWISSPGTFTSSQAMPTVSPATTTSYYLAVSSTGACVVSKDTVVVTVSPMVTPSVGITASATIICAGVPVTFTATPSGGGASPSYQWQVNGANTGTNSASYTTSALNNNDQVRVILTSSAGCITTAVATSNVITITLSASVSPAVSITSTSTSFCAGTAVTFTANPVNGGNSPLYQWQVNGINTGTNSPSFTSAALNNNDQVKVILNSSLSCAVPSTATSTILTVTVTPNVVPAVSISSSAASICPGNTVTFTAIPSNGGNAPAYQWKVNGINAGTNSPIFISSTLVNADQVKVVLTSNASCASPASATSNSIAITVNTVVTPAVSITASTTNTCGNNPVTFTATPVNGGPAPVYQWQVNGTNTGTNSPSFTSTTLTTGDAVRVRLTSNTPCPGTNNVLSNVILMTNFPNVLPHAKAVALANLVCINKTYAISFVPINVTNNSVIQLWESTNNANYVLKNVQTFTGASSSINFTAPASPALYKYYFAIIPPATSICELPNNSDTAIVTILNAVTPVIGKNNQAQLFVKNPNQASAYSWQIKNTAGNWVDIVPAATGIVYNAAANGEYRAAANNSLCIIYSNSIIINSFRKDNGNAIVIYPNPAHNAFTIDSLLLLDKWNTVEIMSADGKMLNARYSVAGFTSISLNIDNIQSGIYLLIFKSLEGTHVVRRLVKL